MCQWLVPGRCVAFQWLLCITPAYEYTCQLIHLQYATHLLRYTRPGSASILCSIANCEALTNVPSCRSINLTTSGHSNGGEQAASPTCCSSVIYIESVARRRRVPELFPPLQLQNSFGGICALVNALWPSRVCLVICISESRPTD